MNYKNVLERVEEKINQSMEAGDPISLLNWLLVIEKLKDCGLIQINRGEDKKWLELIQVDKKLPVQ